MLDGTNERKCVTANRKGLLQRSGKAKECYNEAVRQRRDYKEKPKEAKPLTRNAKRLLPRVKRGEPTN